MQDTCKSSKHRQPGYMDRGRKYKQIGYMFLQETQSYRTHLQVGNTDQEITCTRRKQGQTGHMPSQEIQQAGQMYRHETQTDRTGNTERQDTCTYTGIHRQTRHMHS
jgi:hypothetical protein